MTPLNFKKIAFVGLACLGFSGLARAEGWENPQMGPTAVLERASRPQLERLARDVTPGREVSRQPEGEQGIFGGPRPDLLRDLAGE